MSKELNALLCMTSRQQMQLSGGAAQQVRSQSLLAHHLHPAKCALSHAEAAIRREKAQASAGDANLTREHALAAEQVVVCASSCMRTREPA